MRDDYNGWSNRETWAVRTWLDETPDTRATVSRLTREAGDVNDLADKLEGYLDALWDAFIDCRDSRKRREYYGNMFSDIGSLWRVDWQEYAEWLIDNMEEADNV